MKREDNVDNPISRRGFIKRSGICLMGLGLASSAANSIEAAEKKEHRTGMSTVDPVPVIDVHRHWVPAPSTLFDDGMMRWMVDKVTVLRQVDGVQVYEKDGITAVIHPEFSDLQTQYEAEKKSSVTKSLLSLSHGLESFADAFFFVSEEGIMRRLNDCLARALSDYSDQFVFMANVNPFNKESPKEVERCLDTLGAKGIAIGTSWQNQYLDSPELDFFWEFVQDRDEAIFLHPPSVPIGREHMDRYKLEEVVGRPFDTTMTVTRMIYAGVFDRYPKLKVVLPHMAGALPNVIGRLDFAYRLGYKGMPKEQAALCKRMPSEYLKTNLYADTMGFSTAGIRHCIEIFGIDRVLFGSDYAAVPFSQDEQVQTVKALGLSSDDEAKVLWKNANLLFKVL